MGEIEVRKFADGVVRLDIGTVEYYRVFEYVYEYITNAGSTVVVEIVVAVIFIFRQRVPLQKIVNLLLLIRCQVEHLFVDEAVFVNVTAGKTLVIPNRQLVVQVSPGEVQVEIRLIEIEYTVIVGFVDLLLRIEDTQRVVTECGIQFPLPWTARDNGNCRVWRQATLGLKDIGHHHKREEQEKSAHMGYEYFAR